jgi:hypothetical protein
LLFEVLHTFKRTTQQDGKKREGGKQTGRPAQPPQQTEVATSMAQPVSTSLAFLFLLGYSAAAFYKPTKQADSRGGTKSTNPAKH